MKEMQMVQHWILEEDENHIAWAFIDREGESVNSLSGEVLQSFSNLLDEVSAGDYKGLVITSKKKTGFIAGADIEQFTEMRDYEEGLNFLRKGQEVFLKLENMAIPTLALINGFCLGGGCELALACDYRIALDDPKTRIGLPEVMLGIHPGWGGTVRMPRLIGALPAMGLILTGRSLDARRAFRMGVVNAVVPLRQLKKAAVKFILEQPKKKKSLKVMMSNHRFFRPLLARLMLSQLTKKANKTHYPAPFSAIEHWKKEGVSSGAYAKEAESVAKLFVTDTAQNLIRVFFLQTKMKALSSDKTFSVRRVHVIGAGVMGGDIAAWCALKGIRVTLQDTDPDRIAPAIARAHKLYKKKLKLPHLIEAALDRLLPDVAGEGARSADIIIEAIYENLEAKQALFKHLESIAKPGALLASNTSSIPLDDINSALQDPSRLLGVHFFNPVAGMQLVEIVRGKVTSQASIKQAVQFTKQIGKLPLPVKSAPGFLINRILMPYLMESLLLLNEGVKKEEIDRAAKAFGMPMGPIELVDTVGLDVCLSVAKNLEGDSAGEAIVCLSEMVAKNELGKKSGKGFYHYKNNIIQRNKTHSHNVSQDISDRLIFRLLNESAACLREGVVEDADLLDGGMIFGTGFAPFRGGVMHYAKCIGVDQLISKCENLSASYGQRFQPDECWRAAEFQTKKV
jgi:3-hydroxyacyl-CoA dehydrogenase/enoyl-CoA hydratase/3-hydroxybutyryl-CoA epimerase